MKTFRILSHRRSLSVKSSGLNIFFILMSDRRSASPTRLVKHLPISGMLPVWSAEARSTTNTFRQRTEYSSGGADRDAPIRVMQFVNDPLELAYDLRPEFAPLKAAQVLPCQILDRKRIG